MRSRNLSKQRKRKYFRFQKFRNDRKLKERTKKNSRMEDFFDDNADEDLLAAVEGPSKPLTNAQVILDTGVT